MDEMMRAKRTEIPNRTVKDLHCDFQCNFTDCDFDWGDCTQQNAEQYNSPYGYDNLRDGHSLL